MHHRTLRFGGSAIIAGLVAVLSPLTARAQSAQVPVDLQWRAPAECPSREWVLEEVARLLSSSHNPPIPTTATVSVERDVSTRWSGKLLLDAGDAHSERSLDAETCTAVAAAAALVLAIAVEGGVPPPAIAPTTPPAPPPPDAQTQRRPSQAARTPSHGRSQVTLSAAGVIDTNTLPSTAPGGEAALGFAYTDSGMRYRALVALSVFPSETVIASGNEGGVFFLVAASTRGCAGVVRGAFEVSPCVGAELGRMSASGTRTGGGLGAGSGTETFRESKALGLWVSVAGGLLGSWSFSPTFSLFARADGLLALSQPSFYIQNPSPLPNTVVHGVSAWVARGVLGLEVRFF